MSETFGSEEYNLCSTKLEEVIDERNRKVNVMFKNWVNPQILDIYTSFKVMNMSEDSITHTPFVKLLKDLRYKLDVFASTCDRYSVMYRYMDNFHEIYKIIGYGTLSHETYVDQVIYQHFKS